MIPFDDARRRVLTAIDTLGTRRVPLAAACGSVLVGAVVADRDVPPFDHSAMDGYAVQSDDVRSTPATLDVVTVSSAGHPAPRSIGPGEAARILTGAMLVDGADCVIRVEDTDGGDDAVEIRVPGRPEANIRRAGESARHGDVLVEPGTLLNPGHLGVAAGAGLAELVVIRAPRVAVLSTGDELVSPGNPELAPGQIYESNSTVIASLVERMGCPVTVHRCVDDASKLRALVDELASTHDVIISSGGVSMGGEYDMVRQAVAGHDVEFWKIAMKPAKPMAFGRVGDAVLFGLPGNPVSTVVAFEAFVRPGIRKMRGIEPHVAPTVLGVAGEALVRNGDGRTHFLRVRRDPSGRWVSTGASGPHALTGLADAEALAVIGPESGEVTVGSDISLLPLWI